MWEESFRAAGDVLDFWLLAFYPFLEEKIGALTLETARQRPQFLEQWRYLCELTARYNEPGQFICFPGYEWHGDRVRWGDNNVFYKNESYPIDDTESLARLYAVMQGREALIIPHHTAYKLGQRGKDWSVFDEALSPFAEIFSTHGSSEGHTGTLPMERNMAMGPMVQSGSLHEGLNSGHHFGFIASGDIHAAYPTQWGSGVMACYAEKLSREALWESFTKRRVYGVTGDRIKLDFSVAGLEMGQRGEASPPYKTIIKIEGSDALSRVELVRNNEVVKIWPGTFSAAKRYLGQSRYKVRMFFGWGPMRGRHTAESESVEKKWDVEIAVEDGSLLGIEKMWNRFGQRVIKKTDTRCVVELTTGPGEYTLHGNPAFEGMGLELHGTPDTNIHLTINGERHHFSIAESRRFPEVIAFIGEGERFLREKYGVSAATIAEGPYGKNSIYAVSYKVHLFPAVHESEFTAELEWEDVPDRDGESWYYIRVIQNNGQTAWSSPIWVRPR
jgi:hypothetical protein